MRKRPCLMSGGSPYVTVVGGTNFLNNNDTIGDEEAWDAGGGGFSNTFQRPAYQDTIVGAYLNSSSSQLPPSSCFNSAGRAYPDISALAGQKNSNRILTQTLTLTLTLIGQKNSYCIASGGTFQGVAGTSAACPVVAGIFALLNDARFKADKSPPNPNPGGVHLLRSRCKI